jgi:4'-phosphopantetheinyl transferase EntD
MIEELLPVGIASAELFHDPVGLTAHPGEEHLIARAVDKRRKDFIGARHCARLALAKLGEPAVAIGRGERGAPIWPRGIVGSLTHCAGYRGAAVGFAMQARSVGIDAEPHGPLPEGVLDSVSIAPERDWLAGRADDALHADRLLFCAKEATYKAWFPLTGRWLGFEDAHITFTVAAVDDGHWRGDFHSELLVDGRTDDGPPLRSFDGRWLVRDGLVLTAIAVVA